MDSNSVDLISLLGNVFFPVLVTAYLLTTVSKQLNRIKRNQVKILMLIGILLRELGQNGNVIEAMTAADEEEE